MKRIFTFLLFSLLCSGLMDAQIIITEIQYNHPSWDDDEFVEFYNDSGADIQMEGYYIGDGFEMTFPSYNFEAGTYMVIALESATIMEMYGVTALQWDAGTISNSGEDISLYAPDSTLVDYVDFEDNSDGWSSIADGLGHSLSLCDLGADNEDPANWEITVVDAPVVQGKRLSHASPGVGSTCYTGPIVAVNEAIDDIIEGPEKDTASIFFYITNTNGMPSSISITVDPSSTASPGDYTLLNPTFEFSGMVDTFFAIRIESGDDDAIAEGQKKLILNIAAENNVEKLSNETTEIILYDDDNALEEGLLIAGVFEASIVDDDGENIGSGDEFGVELYALKDIPDLSVYSLGTANNGGGTDGVEIPFPAISLSQGDTYFISDNETRFTNFFGFAPDLTHPSIWVTGNDAIELYEQGVVIDTYAPIDEDPADTPWDYDEGWAVRVPETGPDGATPNLDNWIISGIENLIGETNATSVNPYPLNTYAPAVGVDEIVALLNIQISPNPVKEVLNISFDNTNSDVKIIDISIFNAVGALSAYTQVPNGALNTAIDASDFANGIYFAALKTSNGQVVTKKFVK